MPEYVRDLIDFLQFYKNRHPGLFYIELTSVLAILILLVIPWIKPDFSRTRRKKSSKRFKPLENGWLVFLILMLLVSSAPFVLRYSGWFSKEEEITLVSESEYVLGIDVSHYSGRINWKNITQTQHPIQFIFIRATMGSSGRDRHFEENWFSAGNTPFIRGAYHYYRPGEDPAMQFRNYVKTVKLRTGDFRPILDVEQRGPLSDEKLRAGVMEWLHHAEEKFGIKPVLYTGLSFYKKHFEGHFKNYPLWIAAYDGEHRIKNIQWTFHQFTDRLSVHGVQEYVDGNTFKGTLSDLRILCMP